MRWDLDLMKPATESTSYDDEGNTESEYGLAIDVPDSPSNANENRPVMFAGFRWLCWLPITLNVALAVVVCLAILVIHVRVDYVAATLIGFLFVQILLAAVWTTLAPLGLFTRVISGTVFVFILCFCMYYCADRDGGGTSTAVPIVAAMLIQWLLYQIPLWYMRMHGWKLDTHVPRAQNRRAEVQFGIKHMLIWTTIVAAFMGIVRWISPQMELDASGANAFALQFGLHLTLGNSLIAVPIIWGCLTRHYFWLWIIVAVIVCIFVCFVQAMFAAGPMAEYEFLLMVNGAQTIFSIIVMLALRLTGLRLHRVVP